MLDIILESLQEMSTNGPINDPMIDRQGTGHEGCNRDVSLIFNDRALFPCSNSQDTTLRRVNHRRKVFNSIHAEVRQAHRSALELLRTKLPSASATGEIFHLASNAAERFGLSVPNNRR